MIPELVLARAEEAGLELIGICDHNAAENAQAFIEAAQGSPVHVLPGIECETREGVHVLGLFDGVDAAVRLQSFLWGRMPEEANREKFFGAQMVVTAGGEFVRYNRRLLAVSADIALDEMVREIRRLGGLAIPAHVDKTYAGLLGVLCLVPEGLELEAVEISSRMTVSGARRAYPQLEDLACVRSSDAHRLSEIGSVWSVARLNSRSVEELKLAVGGREGRCLEED